MRFDEFFSSYLQSLHVRDIVRDSLEKDPVDRTPEDIEILLEFTQKLEAFNHMTMLVRRSLCKGKNKVFRKKETKFGS